MKSLLNKRLPGILAVGLVALAVGAASAPASASAGATASALTKVQKKKKAKELKKCKKIKSSKKRKACIKKVNKKYAKLAKASKGKTYKVNVKDDFYDPASVNLKVNDSITWDWQFAVSREGHNVSLASGPSGVSPYDFESPIRTSPYTFTRKFTKPGSYQLYCALHTLMRMQVEVTK